MLKVRVTSNNPLGAIAAGTSTWSVAGARVRGRKAGPIPIVRNGNAVFTTLIPDADPATSAAAAGSWSSNADGSRLDATPFDLNGDGKFTNGDYVTITLPDGTTYTGPVGGLGSDEGILQSPGVIEGEQNENPVQYKYLPGSSGGIQSIIENPGLGGTGRQSWRQIR